MRNHIMLHHSLTADSKTVSWGAIRRYHLSKGWRDIGYHYGVELVNEDYEVLVGRPEHWLGAACLEGKMNELAFHVCCVGNYDLIEPHPAMLDVLVDRVVVPLIERNKISPDAIVGHRDYATYKSCPGKLFSVEKVRKLVWSRLAARRV